MAQIARMPRRASRGQNMIDLLIKSFPTPLRAVGVHPLAVLLLVAVARQAGELALAQQPHLKTRAGKVQTSLLAATRVMMRTAKRIVVNASLLPTNLPMVGGAAVALAALAVAQAVVQEDLARLAAPSQQGQPASQKMLLVNLHFY